MYRAIGSPGLHLPCSIEDHHCDAGDGLGHGIDPEDRVLIHRRAAGKVFLAVRLEVDDLAVTRQDRDAAGNLFVIDLLLQQRV